MPKFGTKNVLFGYFCARILKDYCYIWNHHSQTCLIAKFCEKARMPKFATKKYLKLGPKILSLSVFKLEFENDIVIFEISTFEFV